MTTLDEVVLQLVEEIQTTSTVRRVSGDGLHKLHRSLRKLVSDGLSAYNKTATLFGYASIHKNRNRYTASRYSKQYSYRIHIERAYMGLVRLGYIREMKKGFFDGSGGFLTRYRATEKLRRMFADVDVRILPVLMAPSVPDEVIQVKRIEKERDKKTGKLRRKSIFVDYLDVHKTHQMRRNVDKINKNIQKVWIDIEQDDDDWSELRYRLKQESDADTPPHNLANRTLYRVFSDTSFERGGRFYGGWWQNIPKEFRTKLLINGKRTVEFDYSGLHPALLYARVRAAIPDDPYEIGLDSKHRKQVKKAFNAMLNADHDLRSPPKKLPIKEMGLPWKDLKQRIKDKHSAISDYFGTGEGLKLQYMDSCIAEELMLRFIEEKSGTALLPIHDSFIVHHGYAHELRNMMLEIFERDFGNGIGVKELEKEIPDIADDLSLPMSTDIHEILQLNYVGHEVRLCTHRKYILSQG